MPNRSRTISLKPPRIKKKKILAGHYVYGGYHIKKIERGERRRPKCVWQTENPSGTWLGAAILSFRTVTLARALDVINNERTNLWAAVHQIEAERKSS